MGVVQLKGFSAGRPTFAFAHFYYLFRLPAIPTFDYYRYHTPFFDANLRQKHFDTMTYFFLIGANGGVDAVAARSGYRRPCKVQRISGFKFVD
jgi:hypothetical protein